MIRRLRIYIRGKLDKWLFQLRDAERGEIVLNHRRVFIVPSRPGIAFGIMLMLLFVGAVNYGLGLGFALTFLIAGCAIVDILFTFRNLAHLRLAPGQAAPVFVGEEARFELQLINGEKRPRYAIRIGFLDDKSVAVEHAADVPALSACDVRLSTPAVKRGWLQAPRIRLQTRFPLGLFRAWSYWRPDIKALVYPCPEDNAPPLPTTGIDNDEGSGEAGQEEFAGLRNYQLGDPLNRLAWRQIARLDPDAGGGLISKHFEGGGGIDLCFDLEQMPRHLDLEAQLSRLTRWVLEADARGLAFAFRLGDFHLPAAAGPAHSEACLRALALYGEQ